MLTVAIAPHPLLEVGAFVVRLDAPLGELALPPGGNPPLTSNDGVKTAVRDLLRAGGFKPSGRSKPASEYLANNALPVINPLVDACNLVSLHSGLPISVVDLDRLVPPLSIGVAPAGSTHVFNASGQTLDTAHLLALFDAEGSTGTPVKDAQRTKTSPETRNAIVVVWGTTALPGRTATATAWYRDLLTSITTIAGVAYPASIEDVVLSGS